MGDTPRLHTDPRVTVIIPTRNRAHVLRRSIDSVLAQTVESLELIVIDDASDDETEGLVKGINDPRVRYIRCQRPSGAPAARNVGIRVARGQYLAFQDSDDEWLPAKLERQLELIEQCAPSADLVTCGTVCSGPDGRERAVVAKNETLSYEGLLAFDEPPWGGPTILVRQTPATRRILFDERLPAGQDWDYVIRVAQVTKVVSVREPLVKIGRAAGARISTLLNKLEGRRLLREKHESELRRHPRALVSHEVGIGALSISCGQFVEARRRFVNALRIDPFQPRLVAWLLASFVRESVVLPRIFR